MNSAEDDVLTATSKSLSSNGDHDLLSTHAPGLAGGAGNTEMTHKNDFKQTITQRVSVDFGFPVIFTRNCLAGSNPSLDHVFATDETVDKKVAVFVDSGVAEKWPNLERDIQGKFSVIKRMNFVGEFIIVSGGEEAKHGLEIVETVGRAAAKNGIDRQSYILAIGGGAMLDAVGLGAALVHRGVRLVRMPTTVLSQNDAGIGVKNGVNAYGQKNFFGCFAPPHAVINDFAFLATLDKRQVRAGISEAVKVAAIKDLASLEFIENNASKLADGNEQAIERLVFNCARLHLDHTSGSGDPFENGSARPLDFGHWSAHWLEIASGGRLNHGEAVAIGIALDMLYAEAAGLVSSSECHRVIDCLKACGLRVWDKLLEAAGAAGELSCLGGLEQFREHLGGQLTITLPNPLGDRIEIHSMDKDVIGQCVRRLKLIDG
jgi:3-dehydroquinate synthase